MAKVVLSDLTSIQNDPSAVDTINNNSEIIEDAFDNTLSRDGSTPNQMESNLDMNNNRILNLPRPFNPNEPARLRDVGDARSLAEDAAASAAAAAISASEAQQSSEDAADHEAGANASAIAAHASEVAAASSASSASASASTATTQAGIATTQATNAGNSATAAAGSASSASTSATNAANSASSASSSASAASTSATNASNSATAASGSASSAATSATNAGSSATAASGSASAAASSATAAHTSEVNAGTSATNAASSASTASTQASNAASSASAASTSASNAASSASSASTSASNASASASSASTSASNALTSENNAEQALEDFQDIYLGAYASDPSTTPSGAAISTGMMYWNTAVPELRIYNGSSWSAYSPSGGSVSSVFGRTGAVVASSGDYNFNQLSGNISTGQMASGSGASSSTYWRGDGTWSSPAGGVTSVFGRSGAVTATSGDYTVAQVTGAAPLASPTFTGTPVAPTPTARDNSTKLATTAYVDAATREKLSANRTYYIRTDGSDSNNGLANSSGGAFATPQAALNAAAKIDFNGFVVTIQIGDGTYTGYISIPAMVGQAGVGSLLIQGNVTTPSNVVLTQAGSYQSTITVPQRAAVTLSSFRVAATNNGYGFQNSGGTINYSNIDFGACAVYHIFAEGGLTLQTGNVTISGNAIAHWGAGAGAYIKSQNRTITASTSIAFGVGFAAVTSAGVVASNGNTFSGTFTGPRYNATANGVINTYGSGSSYFPGGTAGSTATGGQYL